MIISRGDGSTPSPIPCKNRKEREIMKELKTLYFEGAGCSDDEIGMGTVGNCRIRTAFHLVDGRAIFLEIIGDKRTKYSTMATKWMYTGFVDACHYITHDIPNDDSNVHKVLLADGSRPIECNTSFEYTEGEILRLVNSLGARFDAIMVVPDLGGYKVFPERRDGFGPSGYYYGDEFVYDPELTARREAVFQHYYNLEKEEGRESPNFSMWVDEFDPGLLHLLRHFAGDFKTAHNRHWLIRVDGNDELDKILATEREATLGRYGC